MAADTARESMAGEMTERAGRRPFPLPPALWPGTPRESLGAAFVRARWLLVSYWVLLVSGYVVLAAGILSYGHASRDERWTTVGFMVTSMAGVLLGNTLGLLRVRPWVVQGTVVGLTAALGVAAAQDPGAAQVLGARGTAELVAFMWSAGCGHLTLQRRMSLATLWIPVICWAGAMIGILERHGRLHAWELGHKSAVWEPLTAGLLGLMVVEVFLFLAGQEHYHTAVWQAHGANVAPLVTRGRGEGGRITGKGVVAILVLAVAVSGATALVAPYLWRTGVAAGEHRGASGEQAGAEEPHGETDWQGIVDALARAAREVQREGRVLLPFIPLFLLNRPVRRAIRLRHWRRPLFPVQPSQRAANLWRTVGVALGDVGLAPGPGVSMDDTVVRVDAARAAKGLPPVTGLMEAAELHQRVRYGLGIPEGALDALEGHAVAAYRSIRAPLSPWGRVKSWWRSLEH